MPDHPIRLRGGWELHDADAPPAAAVPLTLPTEWPPRSAPRRLRLVRRFGAPAADAVRLSLETVDGLRGVILNDVPLAVDRGAGSRLVIDLPPLEPRNVLTLEVDLPGSSTDSSPPWGLIALIVVE